MERMALVDNSGAIDLSVDLRKALALGPLDGLLKFKARAAGQAGEDSVKLHVPGPDVVRLIACDAAGNEVERPASQPKAIPLRPFPNRETAFLLKVKNESENEKELSIELVAPRDGRSAADWEKSVLDERHELAEGMTRLFDPISLKIPAGALLPMPFAETPAAEKSPDKAADKLAAKPAATVAAPAGQKVTNGFAVVIRDKSDKNKVCGRAHRVQALEAQRLSRSPLRVQRPAGRSCTLRSWPRTTRLFPAVTPDNPIQVRFATDPSGGLGAGAIESRSQNVDFRAQNRPRHFRQGPSFLLRRRRLSPRGAIHQSRLVRPARPHRARRHDRAEDHVAQARRRL